MCCITCCFILQVSQTVSGSRCTWFSLWDEIVIFDSVCVLYFNKCCNILNIWEPFIPGKFTKHLKNLKEQSGIKTSEHPASLSCWIRGYKANNHAQLCWIVTAKTQWICSCLMMNFLSITNKACRVKISLCIS